MSGRHTRRAQVVLAPFISRSGSTFLFNQLSAHPEICVCPEAEALIEDIVLAEPSELGPPRTGLLARIGTSVRDDHKLKHWGLDVEAISAPLRAAPGRLDILQVVLEAYRDRTKPAARVLLFKGPQALFAAFEGGARFADGTQPLLLGIVRDGRACYASQKRAIRPKTGTPMQVSPLQMATLWQRYLVRLHQVLAADQAPSHYLVQYESLIQTPVKTLSEVLNFLGVDAGVEYLADGTQDLLARIPVDQQHLHPRVGGKADMSRLTSWQTNLSALEIRLFEDVAGEQLAQHGYAALTPRVSWLRRRLGRLYYFFRLRVHRWRSASARVDRGRLERNTL